MDSHLSYLILIVVSAGALLFIGYLVQDYFSKAARATRRRKLHADKKLKRIREHSGPSAP
jgi:hypothetical protein